MRFWILPLKKPPIVSYKWTYPEQVCNNFRFLSTKLKKVNSPYFVLKNSFSTKIKKKMNTHDTKLDTN